jgi:tRNA threonylcarbamoyl adenosine modification protein YeaZ
VGRAFLRVLAIETSLGETSVTVALLGEDKPNSLWSLRRGREKGQAEDLMPMIEGVMREGNFTFQALDRIAVCTGPGGFSAIRTGVAAARGLGLAANKPVVGLGSFDLMAHQLMMAGPFSEPGVVFGLAIPAGHAAVFCACYTMEEKMNEGIEMLPLDEAAHWFAERVSTVSGPAAPALIRIAERDGLRLHAAIEGLAPDSEPLAMLAPMLDPERDFPIPLYARFADAKPQTAYAVARKPEP